MAVGTLRPRERTRELMLREVLVALGGCGVERSRWERRRRRERRQGDQEREVGM